jgi:hypothetical protein
MVAINPGFGATAGGVGNSVSFVESDGEFHWITYRRNDGSKKLLYTARSKDLGKWESFQMSSKIPGSTPTIDERASLVALDDKLYLFWMDSEKKTLFCARYQASAKDPTRFEWSRAVRCLNTEKKRIVQRGDESNAGMAAVKSADRILVSVNHGATLDYYVFLPGTWGVEWQAEQTTSLTPKQFNEAFGTAFSSFGRNQAMVLCALDGASAYAVQMVECQLGKVVEWWTFALPLGNVYEPPEKEGQPDAVVRWKAPLPPKAGTGFAERWPEPIKQASLTTDPSGRVAAITRSFANALQGRTLARIRGTWTWSKMDNLPVMASSSIPSVFFAYGARVDGLVDGKHVVDREVYRSVVYRNSKEVVFMDRQEVGYLRKVMRDQEVDLTNKSDQRICYLQGYIDGPAPAFDGMIRAHTTVNYAKTSATANSYETETNVTVGMKATMDGSPFIGVGAAWEAAFSLGVGSAFGHSESKSVSQSTQFVLRSEHGAYRQNGLARYSAIRLCRDSYTYYEGPVGAGKPVENGPVTTSIYLDFDHDGKLEYPLGTVTVGKLETYTPEAWDRRMREAGLYPGKNYLEEIVKPRAVRFRNGQPTVRDVWTPGSPLVASFESTAMAFNAASMGLDTVFNTGVSIEFFGAEATFMSTFESQIRSTERSSREEGFGLEVNIEAEPGGPVAEYRVATYLLPASNDWVRELLHFTKVPRYTIADSAQCWKIMFVVDRIVYNDALDALALPDATRTVLRDAGVERTADALAWLGLETTDDLRDFPADQLDENGRALIEALQRWDVTRNLYPADRR